MKYVILATLLLISCGNQRDGCKSIYSSWKNPRLTLNFTGLSEGTNMILQVVEHEGSVFYCNYQVSIDERKIEIYYLYGDSSEVCRKHNHKYEYSHDCNVLYLTENNQTETLF